MRWTIGFSWAAALLNLVTGASALGAATVTDPETGFTFSEYTTQYALGKAISFRTAIPSNAAPNTAYDAVLQLAAPMDVGWAGFAWGGTMVYNPLTVGWSSGWSGVVVSSQRASGSRYNGPSPYYGVSYTILKTGTRTNGTHWQFTVKCSGCTAYESSTGTSYLNPDGSNRFAFAMSFDAPYTPSSNTSTFPVHDVHYTWSQDFAAGKNSNFDELVTRNM